MFDSLIYIPTILAYTFVTLLVVILGFIVIYVSHKIYASIYDNLPVAQLSSSSSALGRKLKTSMAVGAGIASGPIMAGRKSKTALRIIVTLEPCYLAYLLFKPDCSTSKIAASSSLAISQSNAAALGGHHVGQQSLVKYFDDLSAIPTSRQLKRYHDNLPNTKSKLHKYS